MAEVELSAPNRRKRRKVDRGWSVFPLLELWPEPNAFFFRDVHRRPDRRRLLLQWLRAGAARAQHLARDLYSTKDTYISICMSNRVDLSWLSDQTEVSEWTIKKHYGR